MNKSDRDTKNQNKKQEVKEQNEEEESGKKADTNRKYEEYDPCPHKVWTPKPGERDRAAPRGFGSPWYVPVRKKVDIDKEMKEKDEKDAQKRKEESKRRQKEKKEKERKENEEKEEKMRRDMKKQKSAEARKARVQKEADQSNQGVENRANESRTDFSQELIWIMDFISNVDENERIKHGEAIRWKKEEIEHDLEPSLAKKAHTRDFKTFLNLLMEAEIRKTDKRLKQLEREERRRRKQLLQHMDPLSKELMEVGNKFKYLVNATMGNTPGKGEGEANPLEDMMVRMIVNKMTQQ